MNVGIVGCGMIVKPYLRACGESKWLNLAACSDLLEERAAAACAMAAENGWGSPRVRGYEEILADGEIDLVLNLTNPKAHFDLNMRALEAGKHVHAEKPLCVSREEGRELLQCAAGNNVRLGCAPDTFLGSGHQTARALIDDGAIGEPLSITLFFVGGGPDGYHEDPEFFFQAGAGPMFDVGVYCLTDVINLLGAVKKVAGMTSTAWDERTVLSRKKYGRKFKVEVPTHVSASLEFANGTVGTFVTSFDIKGGHHLPRIEIYGTEGTLCVPDPNGFGGKPVLFRTAEADKGWREIEPTHGYGGGNKGIGAADMAAAIAGDRVHRAGGDLAFHVLDVGLSIYESSDSGKAVDVTSSVERPLAFPAGVTPDIVA